MQQVNRYNPMERQAAKQRAREQDDRDLRSGIISREELSRQNGFFSSIDMSKASMRIRSRG